MGKIKRIGLLSAIVFALWLLCPLPTPSHGQWDSKNCGPSPNPANTQCPACCTCTPADPNVVKTSAVFACTDPCHPCNEKLGSCQPRCDPNCQDCELGRTVAHPEGPAWCRDKCPHYSCKPYCETVSRGGVTTFTGCGDLCPTSADICKFQPYCWEAVQTPQGIQPAYCSSCQPDPPGTPSLAQEAADCAALDKVCPVANSPIPAGLLCQAQRFSKYYKYYKQFFPTGACTKPGFQDTLNTDIGDVSFKAYYDNGVLRCSINWTFTGKCSN